jgi:hypothetical protein
MISVTYKALEEQSVGPFEERRRHVRLRRQLQVTISLPRLSNEVSGETKNLSQAGALVSLPGDSSFNKGDQVSIHLLLPPEMTGQRETLVLMGPAVVQRIDHKSHSLALQFSRKLSTFERSQPPRA